MRKLVLLIFILPTILSAQVFKDAYVNKLDVVTADYTQLANENPMFKGKNMSLYGVTQDVYFYNNNLFIGNQFIILKLLSYGTKIDSLYSFRNDDINAHFYSFLFRNNIFCTWLYDTNNLYLSRDYGHSWDSVIFGGNSKYRFLKLFNFNNFLGDISGNSNKLLITKNHFLTIDTLDILSSVGLNSFKATDFAKYYYDFGKDSNEFFTYFQQKIYDENDSSKIKDYKGYFIKSEDGGKNWQKFDVPGSYLFSFKDVFQFGDTILALGINHDSIAHSQIYESSDRGETWKTLIKNDSFPRIFLFKAYDSKSMIFSVSDIKNSGNNGLYVTEDGGLSWNKLVDSKLVKTNSVTIANAAFDSPNSAYIIDANTIYHATFEPFKDSVDIVHKTWKPVFVDTNVDNTYIVVSFDDQVFLSVNPTTYFNPNRIFKSSDEGDNWEEFTHPETSAFSGGILQFYNNNNLDFWTVTYSGIFKFDNSSKTWIKKNTGLEKVYVDYLTSQNDNLFCSSVNYGVFSSSDNGEHWYQANNGLSSDNINVLQSMNNNLFAGGGYGGLFKTSDLGDSWKDVTTFPTLHSIRCFATVSGTLFAGTFGDGVIKSNDDGANWTKVNTGITDKFVYSMTTSGNTLFAGTDNGIFMTSDLGATWERIDSGFAYSDVRSMVTTEHYLFATDRDGKLYRAPLNQFTDDVQEPTKQNTENSLSPNPAADFINAGDYFGYDYQIIDLLGNIAASGTVDGEKINVLSLAPGFYSIVFTKGGQSRAEKFIKE